MNYPLGDRPTIALGLLDIPSPPFRGEVGGEEGGVIMLGDMEGDKGGVIVVVVVVVVVSVDT